MLGVLVSFSAPACSVAIQARASVLRRDAVDAERVAGLARSTAKVLIASGRAVEEVEQIVRATGVDADSARRIVAEVQAELSAK
jgi:hypothetical protein